MIKMMNNEKEVKLQEAFDVVAEQFQKDYEFSKKRSECFSKLMWDIIVEREVGYPLSNGKVISKKIKNRDDFYGVTGLSPSTYDRIRRNVETYVPSLRTFMTLCMVYELDIVTAVTLRNSFGYGFNARDKLHQAYCYLLVNCRGKSLSYCNKVLKALGIKEKAYLGDGTIDEFEVISEL